MEKEPVEEKSTQDEAQRLWDRHLEKNERKRAFVSPLLLLFFGTIALLVLIAGLWIVAIE